MVNSVGKVLEYAEIMDLDISASEFVDIYRYLVANVYDLDDDFLVQMKLLRKILSCSVCTNIVSQPFSVEGCDHFACKNCLGLEKQPIYFDNCDNVNCHDWSKHCQDELILCYVAMFIDLCKYMCTTNKLKMMVQADPNNPLWTLIKEGIMSLTINENGENDNDDDDPQEFLLEHLNSETILNVSDQCEEEQVEVTEHITNGLEVTIDDQGNETEDATTWVTREPDEPPVIINLTSLKQDSSTESLIEDHNQLVQSWAESQQNIHSSIKINPLATNSSNHAIPLPSTYNQSFSTSIVGSVVRTDESTIPAKKLKVRLPKPRSQSKVRSGCRCGNATALPGKLTCCGQRCPCYVDAKACFDCRCKGCRNPHLPGGKKLLQGISAVIDTKTNSALQLPHSSITPVVAATEESVFGIHQGTSFAHMYPVGTVSNFAGFSIPLPVLSVTQQPQSSDVTITGDTSYAANY